MREESNIRPEKNYKIENITDEGKCDIVFYDDIQEETRESGEEQATIYTYDLYRVTVRYRDTLEEDVENNYETWLQYAKENTQEN